MVYDERVGMVAVYEGTEKLNCLSMSHDAFVFVHYFERDASGGFVRDATACAKALTIANAGKSAV